MSNFLALYHPRGRQLGFTSACALGAFGLVLAMTQDTSAQSAFLSRNDLQGVGLVRSWAMQSVATASQELHATLHCSKTRNIHVFEVVSSEGTQSFAEGTIGPQGRLMSEAEANRQADIALRRLKLQGIEAVIEPSLVPELTLVLRSDAGQVEALDAETGRVKWQMALGPADQPAYDPGFNDRYVGVVSGSTLYVAEVVTGKLILQKRIGGIPGGGPVLTDSFAIVPLYRNAMELYPLDAIEAKRGPSWLTSFGSPTASPILAGATLAWPTDRGAVYFADGESAEDLFRVRTRSRITGQVAFAPPDRFFVGTEGGYLVCIDRQRESVVWDYLLGAPCAGTPYVLADSVYAVTTERQLHCVDIKLGIERWIRGGIRETITGFEDRLLARQVNDYLVQIDATSGQVLAQASLPATAKVIHNATSDRLYFAEGGRISCFRGLNRPWPTIYGQVAAGRVDETSEKPAEESALDEPSTTESLETATETDSPFAEDNPFDVDDSGGDENPFGSDDDQDDPFGFN